MRYPVPSPRRRPRLAHACAPQHGRPRGRRRAAASQHHSERRRGRRAAAFRGRRGRARVGLPYDELAIATGATPESPPIGGVDAPGQDDGVFLLHTMIYSWRYPESIHRSVMIGVNPPRALRVGSGNDGRTDPALRSPLLQRRQLPRPDRRPSAPADDLMRRTCGPHLQRQ
jgi:hypothetical protein